MTKFQAGTILINQDMDYQLERLYIRPLFIDLVTIIVDYKSFCCTNNFVRCLGLSIHSLKDYIIIVCMCCCFRCSAHMFDTCLFYSFKHLIHCLKVLSLLIC